MDEFDLDDYGGYLSSSEEDEREEEEDPRQRAPLTFFQKIYSFLFSIFGYVKLSENEFEGVEKENFIPFASNE